MVMIRRRRSRSATARRFHRLSTTALPLTLLASPALAARMPAVPTQTAAQASAQPPASAQAQGEAPRAVVAEATRDLGVVGFGTSPVFEFTFQNTGKTPLTVATAKLPDVLRAEPPRLEVAPGASATLRFRLDTFRAGATTEWKVPVGTNDPAQPSVTLTLKADVRSYLAINPPTARFIFVQYGKPGGTTHVIGAVDGSDIEVTGVDSPFDFIKATSRELKGDERVADFQGRQWQIVLTISDLAPVGPIGKTVVVRTTHPQQPQAFLQVSGFVRPLFAVTPQSLEKLTLPAAPAPGKPVPVAALTVKNFGEESLALTGASSDIPGLAAEIVEVEKGHSWRVALRLDGATQGSERPAGGAFKGTLRLKTGSARVPELTVPIEGSWIAGPPRE
jgi:hypothetical protein